MTARRAALLLLVVLAACLTGEFLLDDDHGADFASEIGSWGASAVHRSQPAHLTDLDDVVLRIGRQSLECGEDHRCDDAAVEVRPPLRDAPTGVSPPASC